MNVERLTHLIEILRQVESSHRPFDLTVWASTGVSPNTTSGSAEACGTSACALGYAALDPQFQAQGLALKANVYALSDTHFVERCIGEITVSTTDEFNEVMRRADVGMFDPVYGEERGFSAGAEFFGINREASNYLFDPDYYPQGFDAPILPAQVIARIEDLLANHGEPSEGYDADETFECEDDEEEDIVDETVKEGV